MRRSLGSGGGRGMGGGTMRTFQRAVRAGVGGAPPKTTANIGGAKAGKANNFNKKQPISPNTALTLFSSSSAAPSQLNLPIPAASAPASWISSSSTVCSDESEWDYVDGIEDETAARGLYEDYVFGTVPSRDEVHHAVSALQKAFTSPSHATSAKAKLAEVTNKDVAANHIYYDEKIISRSDSEMDWVEPSKDIYSSKVYDAFHLLETEPSVQRMVVSLSSDKAIWDAVLNNEVVKELRGSIDRAASIVGESSKEASDDSDGDDNILGWIVTFVKSKMTELLDFIATLVNSVFKAPNQGKKGDDAALGERVKSSFFLSVVVLLVVVLARTKIKNA